MDFSKHIRAGFSNCRLFCRIKCQGPFSGEWINIYSLPDSGGIHFGAAYPDGARMIWPVEWLDNKPRKDVEGPFKAGKRVRVCNFELEEKASLKRTLVRLSLNGS